MMNRTMSFYDLRDALSEPGCPICRLKARAAERYLDGLLWESVNDPGVRAQVRRLLSIYEASEGLCLPHFRQALRCVRDEAVFQSLVNAQRAIWRRLANQLAEAIRKSDARFRDEPAGDESGAWLRGIAALSGAPVTGRR
jgi:hypothetical protein